MKAFIVLALAAAANAFIIPATPYAYAGAPLAYAPYAYPWAVTPSTQYRAQDEFGNLNFGYANINSARHEAGNGYLGVTGSYQYVDANGKLQTTTYIADALGYRVQATNLPVAPVADLVQPENTLVGPEPVVDTPEVAAAKAEFAAAYAAAEAGASRKKRQAEDEMAEEAKEETKIVTVSPYGFNYGLPYGAWNYGLPAYTTAYGLPAYTTAYGLPAPYFGGYYGGYIARKKRETPADTAELEIPKAVEIPVVTYAHPYNFAYGYAAPAPVYSPYGVWNQWNPWAVAIKA